MIKRRLEDIHGQKLLPSLRHGADVKGLRAILGQDRTTVPQDALFGLRELCHASSIGYENDMYALESAFYTIKSFGFPIDADRMISSIRNNHGKWPININAIPEGHIVKNDYGNRIPLVTLESADDDFPEVVPIARHLLKDLGDMSSIYLDMSTSFQTVREYIAKAGTEDKFVPYLCCFDPLINGHASELYKNQLSLMIAKLFFGGTGTVDAFPFTPRHKQIRLASYRIPVLIDAEQNINYLGKVQRLKALENLLEIVDGPVEVHYTLPETAAVKAEILDLAKLLTNNDNGRYIHLTVSCFANKKVSTVYTGLKQAFDYTVNDKGYTEFEHNVKLGFLGVMDHVGLGSWIRWADDARLAPNSMTLKLANKMARYGRSCPTWMHSGVKIGDKWQGPDWNKRGGRAMVVLDPEAQDRFYSRVNKEDLLPGDEAVDLLVPAVVNGLWQNEYPHWTPDFEPIHLKDIAMDYLGMLPESENEDPVILPRNEVVDTPPAPAVDTTAGWGNTPGITATTFPNITWTTTTTATNGNF